jgi:glycerol uptake facilitator-like aquaporin
MREYIVEFIGTFTLVLVGVGAVASGQGLLVGALSHGLVVIGIIYTYSHLCPAYFNPAVTLAMLVGRQISVSKAVGYWIAQFAAAIAASLLLRLLIGEQVVAGQTIGVLTRDAVWTAALFEAIQVFLLVSTIYQAAVYGKAGNLAGLVIGITLAALILMGGVYTGASINPARTLGPALVASDLGYVLPYFAGLFGGAAVGGWVHSRWLKPD